ncbi:MAG: hypothetical protein RBT38_01640 [Bacteroidales bacterium]|jgi:hypothetical protein|nr:hypothetical protein [Bacteroidales bacterium]
MRFTRDPKFILLLLVLVSASTVCEAQSGRPSGNPEKQLFGRSLKKKQVKYREAPSIVRARKKQEAKQKKLDKEYDEYVKAQRKRAVEIQSPEVQVRMKQNRKDADQNYREKRKKEKENSKRSRKKYR